jgi:hypothetical protein
LELAYLPALVENSRPFGGPLPKMYDPLARQRPIPESTADGHSAPHHPAPLDTLAPTVYDGAEALVMTKGSDPMPVWSVQPKRRCA